MTRKGERAGWLGGAHIYDPRRDFGEAAAKEYLRINAERVPDIRFGKQTGRKIIKWERDLEAGREEWTAAGRRADLDETDRRQWSRNRLARRKVDELADQVTSSMRRVEVLFVKKKEEEKRDSDEEEDT